MNMLLKIFQQSSFSLFFALNLVQLTPVSLKTYLVSSSSYCLSIVVVNILFLNFSLRVHGIFNRISPKANED